MFKLYFKFGSMGSSKTAQALMCKFNYEQKGMKVLLIKPLIDKRDMKNGKAIVRSRIGLESECVTFSKDDNLFELYQKNKDFKVIIVDECQFCTKTQIEQLKEITKYVPVFCYGLKTNFKTELFEASKRLLEIADSISEIKSVCRCGLKAIINARVVDDQIVYTGDEIVLGGEESYVSICYNCYLNGKI